MAIQEQTAAGARPAWRFGVSYDFRNPPDSGIAMPDLYQGVLEQIRRLDRLGLDLIWFTEHHFVDDGYLPSWVPVAAAAAALTERVRFSSDICLLPFNHPLRLAEDLAVLDNLSNGRVELGAGIGYAPHEFAGFGLPVSRRVSLADEALEVLKLCFTGETFSYAGRRYQFDNVRITPGYVQPGGPPLWVAAMSAPGARRAARFGAHLLPQGDRRETLDVWRKEVEAAGRSTAEHRVGIIKGVLVTEDPERDWPEVRNSERYRMGLYNRLFAESGTRFGAGEHIPQTWVVGDEDHCVAQLGDFMESYGITDLVTWGVPPGLTPERMQLSLERFATGVVPRLRERGRRTAQP